MGKLSAWLYGLGIGAGLMYFLDPQMGDRRKALVRDQVSRLRSRGDDAIDTAMRDLRNRARGFLSEGIAMVSNEGVPDYVVEERVRSRLGFLSRHPGAVQVRIENGRAVLTGDILTNEVEGLLQGVRRIRGVREVQNDLTVHQEAGNIPQLQGEGWMPGDTRASRMWSPSTRLLAGLGAGYLLLYGIARGGLIGLLARVSGLFLGVRAFTNMDMDTMTGKSTDTQAVRIRKGITIKAPVEEVYRLWSNFENFSRFMNNIESIRNTGGNRSHWVVKGPVGSKVEFDAITTENVPNEVIAWETTPDSMVKHTGHVRFRDMGDRTQVNINMAYTPPAGVAGHAVATLFGKDPKSEMDADLARMKTLLEEGKTTSESRRVTREQVMPVTGESELDREREIERTDNMGMDDDEVLDVGMDDEDVDDMNRRSTGGMGGGPLTPSDE